jgi:hypothetical protein
MIALIVILSVLLVANIAIFIVISNYKFEVTKYTVTAKNVPEGGVRIVHLSDLHARRFGKKNKWLLRAVKKQNADLIVFTGDIIHKYRKRDIEVAKEIVREAIKIAPFIYVSGNHEMRNRSWRFLKEQLVKEGAIVLDDATINMCGIDIIGLNCSHLKNNTLFDLVPKDDNFKLLLAHEPQFLSRYALSGCDLVLCGHAHGGQFRLPFCEVGLYAPGQGVLPKFTSGEHRCGKTHMIISRGLGNSEFPLRIFNCPEVVIVDIIKK